MLTNVKNTNLQKKYSTDLNRPFTEETPQEKRQSPPGGQRNGTRDGGGDTAPGDRRQRGRPTLRGGGEAAPPAPGLRHRLTAAPRGPPTPRTAPPPRAAPRETRTAAATPAGAGTAGSTPCGGHTEPGRAPAARTPPGTDGKQEEGSFMKWKATKIKTPASEGCVNGQ